MTPTLAASLLKLCRAHEPLARHTTMKVGGPVAFWAEPQDEAALIATLEAVRQDGLRLQIIGNGSNLIGSDDGFEGVALKLGAGFDWARVEGNLLICGGAMLLPKLPKLALQHQLGNMEWACGIPGSVGGSIWGNAGARGWNGHDFESRDSAADLEGVVAFDLQGRRHVLRRHQIDFAYRRSSLGELIVTEATFALKPLSESQAREHREVVKQLLAKRRNSQPVNAASAGCVWKNPALPDCRGAGELIERLGLKSMSVGGAQISPIHGNFVINSGGASGRDVRDLIERVEAIVLEKTGTHLEREARLL